MTDYRKLIEEARHGTKGYSEGDLRCLARSLAGAIEPLVVENERRSKSWEHAIKANSALIDRLASRDAEVAALEHEVSELRVDIWLLQEEHRTGN
jgi:hypothetical protein